jgi:glycosyltransferase involved in cell wall biosynthesis
MLSGELSPVEIYLLNNDAPQTQIFLASLNEEHGIAYTIKEIRMILNNPKILVVDGNSSDKTAEVAKVLGAKVVQQLGEAKETL